MDRINYQVQRFTQSYSDKRSMVNYSLDFFSIQQFLNIVGILDP